MDLYLRKQCFPPKREWKRIVVGAIYLTENKLLRERLDSDSDFDNFKRVHCSYRPLEILGMPKNARELRSVYEYVELLTAIPGLPLTVM